MDEARANAGLAPASLLYWEPSCCGPHHGGCHLLCILSSSWLLPLWWGAVFASFAKQLSIPSPSPWANPWERAKWGFSTLLLCPKLSLSSPERQCSHCLTEAPMLHAKGCSAKYDASLLHESSTAAHGWLIHLVFKVPFPCTPALGPLRNVWGQYTDISLPLQCNVEISPILQCNFLLPFCHSSHSS